MTEIASTLDRQTVVRLETQEPGDHDKLSHYVEADKIADAMVFGTPLQALCGKVWVPTRDGMKFPVCPECKDTWDALPRD